MVKDEIQAGFGNSACDTSAIELERELVPDRVRITGAEMEIGLEAFQEIIERLRREVRCWEKDKSSLSEWREC